MSLALLFVLCVSCQNEDHNPEVDVFNTKSYRVHYANLDSVEFFAKKAYELSGRYDCGKAEALNNLAFANILRMNYEKAKEQLDEVFRITDNQLELLIANVQMMRVCQRESANREFYQYQSKAEKCLKRINGEQNALSERQRQRLNYGKTEYDIVLAAYLWYMGQNKLSVEALSRIEPNGEILKDTAQLLNYYYNVGSGGFIQTQDKEQLVQGEMDYLINCYMLAMKSDLPYWQANALQSMSEHLQDIQLRDKIISDNLPAMKFLNPENMPDSLLAGNMAQRSVNVFADFGDVYQTAGALRTLSQCYFDIGDYHTAIDCLNEALERDKRINKVPAMVVSIAEQLSIDYAAVNDKENSDNARNTYLDMQNETRQDRYLEARAEQLNTASTQLNLMLAIVISVILLVVVLLVVFTRMRRKAERRVSSESLLQPLRTWQEKTARHQETADEEYEELMEQQQMAALQSEKFLQQNIEQRAKMSLINSITPFIDRMLAEVRCLVNREESDGVRQERYAYIAELTEQINQYNGVLTEWIQLRRGELSLKIESFPIKQLFDILNKGRQSFQMKGVELVVEDSKEWVKADRTLTLFMINTLADNARKFTSEGGRVVVSAQSTDDYVEISVADTGMGMNEEQLANVFSHQPNKKTQHGFGLMNCKGIIEKYRKISSVFSVCQIKAESQEGKGSTFRFRLPKGIVRTILAVCMFAGIPLTGMAANKTAAALVDSVFFFNLQGRYEEALHYSDSINNMFKGVQPDTLDVHVILETNNEAAVAALALHRWDLYEKYNGDYTRLFREISADHTIGKYVERMQSTSSTKNIAIVILVLLLMSIFPAYYLLYYRHRVYYAFLLSKVNSINGILLSDSSDEEKLSCIERLWKGGWKYAGGDKRTMQFETLVSEICDALQKNIDTRKDKEVDFELAHDELNRLNFEIERLHVNNNVLDNCFSTLKHETMYYPSRIHQVVNGEEVNLDVLKELTDYYKELYTILSTQAQYQIRSILHIDDRIGRYLRQLLTKLGEEKPQFVATDVDEIYCSVIVKMPKLSLTEKEAVELFTPQTVHLPCLIIRQIIREIGETTNLRRSGIQAFIDEKNISTIEIIIPKNIWKNLKLS